MQHEYKANRKSKMIIEKLDRESHITPEVHQRLFQHNEKYIKKAKPIVEETKKSDVKISKEEQQKKLEQLMHPASRARIKSPEGDMNTSVSTNMLSIHGGRNNDKFVYEKLKKDVNAFLVSRSMKPLDDNATTINFEEFNQLLDELAFINLEKVHSYESNLVQHAWF